MPLDRLECGSNKSITHPVMMAASPATDQEEPSPCWLVEDKQHTGVGAPGGGRGWSVSDTLSLEPVKGDNMRRTPEEIMKGLECCRESQDCTQDNMPKCPYYEKETCLIELVDDALALIQQLEAKVPHWTSVEESLPAERLCVSVYIQEDGGAYWIETAFRRDGKWRIQGEYVIDRNITHWMHLPEPPQT